MQGEDRISEMGRKASECDTNRPTLRSRWLVVIAAGRRDHHDDLTPILEFLPFHEALGGCFCDITSGHCPVFSHDASEERNIMQVSGPAFRDDRVDKRSHQEPQTSILRRSPQHCTAQSSDVTCGAAKSEGACLLFRWWYLRTEASRLTLEVNQPSPIGREYNILEPRRTERSLLIPLSVA